MGGTGAAGPAVRGPPCRAVRPSPSAPFDPPRGPPRSAQGASPLPRRRECRARPVRPPFRPNMASASTGVGAVTVIDAVPSLRSAIRTAVGAESNPSRRALTWPPPVPGACGSPQGPSGTPRASIRRGSSRRTPPLPRSCPVFPPDRPSRSCPGSVRRAVRAGALRARVPRTPRRHAVPCPNLRSGCVTARKPCGGVEAYQRAGFGSISGVNAAFPLRPLSSRIYYRVCTLTPSPKGPNNDSPNLPL